MYGLNEVLARGNPYGSDTNRIVALTAGDVPDVPAQWHPSDPFPTYARNVFQLARSVIIWWTPAQVEHEALRMASDAPGPSVLSEEAYAFRCIYLQLASMIAGSIHTQHTGHSGVRYIETLRSLLAEAVNTLEHKAQQVEARAMDHRMRYDAQKLRAMLGAMDVSPKLGELIEAAQRGTDTQQHLVELAGAVSEVLRQTAQNTDSIKFIAESYWDRSLDKDAEAKKVTTLMAKVGEKTGDALLKVLIGALVDLAKTQF